MKRGDLISNSQGESFKIMGWRLFLQPLSKIVCDEIIFDIWVPEGLSRIFLRIGSKRYMATRARYIDVDTWVIHRLKYVGYNELMDIRKSYLHGNKYSSKAKANGTNSNVPKVSKRKK